MLHNNTQLELLAPARDSEIAIAAIMHGADAVYMGGPKFGARHGAVNTVDDIAKVCEFAHRYHARVFVALNTILHDDELLAAERLIVDLHQVGVDALIVQDMGVLMMDIPPIELHASTQCDIRTPEKAQFLAGSGFSQLVLARELSIAQIAEIKACIGSEVVVEYFIHGALCVAFSGQCYISHAEAGRSANRGDCSQACRLPYTLTDKQGAVVAFDQHLLSMKDNNQTANIAALVKSGVRSFKIEGRYKDMAYVKNITGHYRQILDAFIAHNPEYSRASSGLTQLHFQPDPNRNFQRGFTDYFAKGRVIEIAAFESPKHMGLKVAEVMSMDAKSLVVSTLGAKDHKLNNGDGVCYLHKRDVHGFMINRAEPLRLESLTPAQNSAEEPALWRIFPKDPEVVLDSKLGLKPGVVLHRNRDKAWDEQLTGDSAARRVQVTMELTRDEEGFLHCTVTDEDGIKAQVSSASVPQAAKDVALCIQSIQRAFSKLNDTEFHLLKLNVTCHEPGFLPAAQLNQMRRDLVVALRLARETHRSVGKRRPAIEPPVQYPENTVSYLANVYNHKAKAFYALHGVHMIEPAFEAHETLSEVPVMITKHCLRYSFQLCPKQAKGVEGVQGQVKAEPMVLHQGKQQYLLKFDCKPCEMHIMGTIKRDVATSLPPGASV